MQFFIVPQHIVFRIVFSILFFLCLCPPIKVVSEPSSEEEFEGLCIRRIEEFEGLCIKRIVGEKGIESDCAICKFSIALFRVCYICGFCL